MKNIMKRFKANKFLATAALLIVTALLFILGKGHETHGIAMAAGAIVSLTEEEKSGFSEQEQKVVLAVKKLAVQMKEQVLSGAISKEDLAAAISGMKAEMKTDAGKDLKTAFAELEEIARKQGTTLSELGAKYTSIETGSKSIGQVLEENQDEIKKVYRNGSGSKEFMIQVNHKGEFVMKPFDSTEKAAGPHASTANVGGAGNTSSIAQAIDAATLLRLGGDSAIVSQYRNTPWILDICNMINAGFEMPFAMWYEEQVKQGASANVAEGGAKPLSQYAYSLKTATYKKEATLIGFTQEFALDFARLQSDILGKGRTDLVNRINSAVLANVVTAATAFNTAASFKQGVVVPNGNDFDVLAAMAAQVDSAQFGAVANAALISTFKKYRMGIAKDAQGAYLNRPKVLDNLSFIGNPDMTADQVLVGDFKQYNVILRGGLIVKVGYNGTDFANNMFSVVLEQFYFDYISSLRTPAIVKGPDFATVKTAITT
jgi:hypothetical protein